MKSITLAESSPNGPIDTCQTCGKPPARFHIIMCDNDGDNIEPLLDVCRDCLTRLVMRFVMLVMEIDEKGTIIHNPAARFTQSPPPRRR